LGLHQLPYQLRLLVAVSDKSYNNLSQRGRLLGQCFVIIIVMIITHLQK